MKWVKASERLPEVEKDDRPIMVDKRYYSAWYSEDKKYWITDYNEIYLSRQVEWLDESECDCENELEELNQKQARIAELEKGLRDLLESRNNISYAKAKKLLKL